METTNLVWEKSDAGFVDATGRFKLVKQSGYYRVFNGSADPLTKRLSLAAAKAFAEQQAKELPEPVVEATPEPEVVEPEPTPEVAPVAEIEISPQAVPAIGYDDFVLTILENGWTTDQIGGDVEQPPELQEFLVAVGTEWVVRWIDRAMETGDLTDAKPVASPFPDLDMQTLVDQLVWDHGKHVTTKSDYPALLAAKGLTPELVAPHLEQAAKNFDARIKRNLNNNVLNWMTPTTEELTPGVPMHVWRTECGQYRIARLGGPSPRFAAAAVIGANSARERVIANDLRSLTTALESVESYHKEQMDLSDVSSNKELIVREAEKLGIHSRPPLPELPGKSTPEPEQEYEMYVTESNARALLKAMDLPDDAPVAKLAKILNDFANRSDGATVPTDKSVNTLRKQVMKANQDGVEIVISDPAEKNGKAPAKEKAKSEKSKDKTNPAKKMGGRSGGGKLDPDFDNLVKRALKAGMLSPKAIKEKLNIDVSIPIHSRLKKMLEQGVLSHSDEGWGLVK